MPFAYTPQLFFHSASSARILLHPDASSDQHLLFLRGWHCSLDALTCNVSLIFMSLSLGRAQMAMLNSYGKRLWLRQVMWLKVMGHPDEARSEGHQSGFPSQEPAKPQAPCFVTSSPTATYSDSQPCDHCEKAACMEKQRSRHIRQKCNF